MILLDETFQVFYKDEKTNISFPFSIDEDTSSLKITFNYSPKILEDDDRANMLIENNIKKKRKNGGFFEKTPNKMAIDLTLFFIYNLCYNINIKAYKRSI